MGKVHSTLEKEVGEIKNRIYCNIIGIFVEKQLTDKQIDLINIYGIADGEAICAVDCKNKKAVTDMGESYEFKELEVDILLWIFCQLEDDEFKLQEED